MSIIQLLPTLSYGDAIGNNVLALRDVFLRHGYPTSIYAELIGPNIPHGVASHFDEFPQVSESDLVIYHASTGSALNQSIKKIHAKKIMVFHNITPPSYFAPYNLKAAKLTEQGYREIASLADTFDLCIADSSFNREELIRMNYSCPINVCPLFIPFEDYHRKPDETVLNKYQDDGKTNWLFVGRIAPNKKQEDIIRAFYCYQREYDPSARLFLVGNDGGMERYSLRLKNYIRQLGLEDSVLFPGHISFQELLAYYQIADAFVCLSEHEGFCVPLLEAMSFSIPVVAYSSSAVPETIGCGGLLLEDRNPYIISAAVHKLLTDEKLNAFILQEQRKNLSRFSSTTIEDRFIQCIAPLIH